MDWTRFSSKRLMQLAYELFDRIEDTYGTPDCKSLIELQSYLWNLAAKKRKQGK